MLGKSPWAVSFRNPLTTYNGHESGLAQQADTAGRDAVWSYEYLSADRQRYGLESDTGAPSRRIGMALHHAIQSPCNQQTVQHAEDFRAPDITVCNLRH